VETCRYNLQTSLLTQIAESHTWKQLVQQGEQAEEIIAEVKVKKQAQTRKFDKAHARSIFSS